MTAAGPPPGMPLYDGNPGQWWRAPIVRIAIAVVLVIVAVVVFIGGRGGKSAGAGEIFREGNDNPGADTFTPSVAAAPVANQAPTATTVPTPSSSGTIRADAGSPGLYAGTRDVPSCNAQQLVTYLEQNPSRAAPWAAALGINRADIRAFVNTLTAVLLTVDTRVTDYGFADGRAVPRPAVLQAGTAVFIDRTAFPRIRCLSGDPLGEPQPVASSPRYVGAPAWPTFSPTTIIVITPRRAPGILILIDVRNGNLFGRIPGSIVIIDIDRPPADARIIIVQPGGPARITGANWPPGTQVTITFDNPNVVLGATTADGGGNIAATVTIPPDAAPGTHTITMTGGGFTVPQTVYVIPRAPTARVRRG